MMSNMQNLLKQAQKLQDDMEGAQKRLKDKQVEGSGGGGAVVFVVDGASDFKSFEIDESFLKNSDKKTIESAILAAARSAVEKAKDIHRQEMEAITSSLKMPGLF